MGTWAVDTDISASFYVRFIVAAAGRIRAIELAIELQLNALYFHFSYATEQMNM